MDAQWTRVAMAADLDPAGKLVVRPGGRQIAVLRTARGLRACDNRCPHEGYPLSEGTLDESCVLTCNWHNWKFRLDDGSNLYGGDRLRVYPVEVRDGEIWLDLADPPVAVRRAEVMASLRDAFDDEDYTRMARELGRLRLLGTDLVEAARAAIAWSHDRLEFGWTHAYAGLAEWLGVRAEHDGDAEVDVACILEGIAHVADDVLREPVHPYPDGIAGYDEDALVAAIEAEDEARALALVRGALGADGGAARVERALARAALAHYAAFGHCAIYVTKARQLIGQLGDAVAEPLLLALVRQIVLARREDLVPEFRRYREALAAWGSRCEPPDVAGWGRLGVNRALARAVDWSGNPPEAVFDALLAVNARQLLAYDIEQQGKVRIPVDDNIGWLDFTHGITFAAAVRELCRRDPALWPAALLQMACFAGRNARYTVDTPALERWRVDAPASFFADETERMLDHDVDEFIVAVHRLKTLRAARDLVAAGTTPATAELVLAAVNRFLHSPLRLKHVRRTVHQAMQFVARG
ncbi:MAG: Rieske (2Fe-2S) protein [Chromatiales bacterium]|nr:Rieske (2Fe-2S) protein [Chromatiales bacterium]